MKTRTAIGAALAIASLVAIQACSGSKATESVAAPDPAEQVAAPAGEETAPGPSATGGAVCIDLGDIQSEPLDLEAVDDETSSPELTDAVAGLLTSLAAYGSPVAIADGAVIVPVARCSGDVCSGSVVTLDPAGRERSSVSLPGVDGASGTSVTEFVTARADVNSDGAPDLWIGYRVSNASRASDSLHLLALSLPDARVQWHGIVSGTGYARAGHGCEGVLYPLDADCDGDGDVVLVQQCGPSACLGDEGDRAGGACEAGALAENASIYRWDPGSGSYR